MFVFNFLIFFFNDTATTEIYTLSLHDALPISRIKWSDARLRVPASVTRSVPVGKSSAAMPSLPGMRDRKSTRLNSSHGYISYAVFCLKKKNNAFTDHKSTRQFIVRAQLP